MMMMRNNNDDDNDDYDEDQHFLLQVTDLKPDTNYVFLVRAENSHGLSLPGPLSDVAHTSSLDQRTVPQIELIRARDRLNSEILHLKEVQPLSSTSVKIMWDVSLRSKAVTWTVTNVNPLRPVGSDP